MPVIDVALVGLGNVGRAAARLLKENRDHFRRRLGAEVRLRWVCDRHPAKKLAGLGLGPGVRVTTDWRDVLGDPEVGVVVELVGGLADAGPLVLGALKAGKHVVTANKQLLSRHWEEVFRLAAERGRRVFYEASVAGGIPVLRAVHESLAADRIRGLAGILNGTTNFILSKMAHEGLEFGAALKEAQRLGMAERDPSLDVSGMDTVHKLSILASLVTGSWVRPDAIPREGIEDVEREDVEIAVRRFKRTVRLLGIARFETGAVQARVHPALVPLDHPLAAVHAGYNGIMVESSAAGDLMFFGRGAGPEPAASAVVGDLFNLCREIVDERRAPAADTLWPGAGRLKVTPMKDVVCSNYLRLDALDRPGVLARVAGALGANGVSIAQLDQEAGTRGRATIVATTHPVGEAAMSRALAGLRRLPVVSRRISRLRMYP